MSAEPTAATPANLPAIQIPEPCRGTEVVIDAKFLARRDALVAEAEQCSITGAESYDGASRVLNSITKLVKDADKHRLDLQRPFADTVKLIRDTIKKAMSPAEDAKRNLKSRLTAFAVEQRRAAEEARRAAEEAERERIAAEIELFGAPQVEEQPMPQPELPAPHSAAKSSATVVVERLAFDLVDIAQVPRQWLAFDPRAVRDYMATNGDALKTKIRDAKAGQYILGGVAFGIDTDVQASSRRGRH